MSACNGTRPRQAADPASSSTPSHGTVPAPAIDVSVSSVSFISAARGWLIGTAHGTTRVEATADGGQHWHPLPAVPPGRPDRIDLFTTRDAEAYGTNVVDVTSDGGVSWRRVPLPGEDGGGAGASAVVSADGLVWVLDAGQDPAIVESVVGSDVNHEVGVAGNRSALLSARGHDAYVLGQQGAGPVAPDLEVATPVGASPSKPVPCHGIAGGGDAGALTPIPQGHGLVLACVSELDGVTPGRSTLWRSGDDGVTWSRFGSASCRIHSLAATTSAFFGSCTDRVVRIATSGGAATTSLSARGLADVTFPTPVDGAVVRWSAGHHGTLFLTHDGGESWTRALT